MTITNTAWGEIITTEEVFAANVPEVGNNKKLGEFKTDDSVARYDSGVGSADIEHAGEIYSTTVIGGESVNLSLTSPSALYIGISPNFSGSCSSCDGMFTDAWDQTVDWASAGHWNYYAYGNESVQNSVAMYATWIWAPPGAGDYWYLEIDCSRSGMDEGSLWMGYKPYGDDPRGRYYYDYDNCGGNIGPDYIDVS
jgi:hypothetical protein